MTSIRYRPEVDGLRALAVMGVVLYHVGLGFSGGYVGVDVFFVISGYLITSLIAKDLRNGDFSMLDFWVRRIKRILPAMIVMVLVCLILGYWILEAGQYRALARSSIAQSLMVANIFFWQDDMSYFAEASDMKPLLHTWSLAVEEQFYVVFPLLLSLLSKRVQRYTLPIILSIGVVSLLMSCWAVSHKPSANFYLLPTRAWELLAGAVVALTLREKLMTKRMAEVGALVGLLMIMSAMFFYDSRTPFPGWTAIPPVAGSALFIWASGNHQTIAGRLLSMQPVVFTGLVSYSLYLWHWPLLVFTKHVIIDLNLSWKLFVLVGSLILSIISWKWVERPFRKRGVLPRCSSTFAFAGLATMSLMLASAAILKMGGLPGRYDEWSILREDIGWKGMKYRTRANATVYIGVQPSLDSEGVRPPDFFLWGDSHAQSMAFAADEIAGKRGLRGVCNINHSRIPVTGLMTDRFPDHMTYTGSVIESILESGVKNVILIARWSSSTEGGNKAELASQKEAFVSGLMEEGDNVDDITGDRSARLLTKHLELMARSLREVGVRIWLIKQVPETNNVTTASDFYWAKRFPFVNEMPEQYTTTLGEHLGRQQRVNRAIDLVSRGLIEVIDPTPYFYENSDALKVYGERSYYRDDDHLTRAGAEQYLTKIFDGIFSRIARQQGRRYSAD